MSTWALTPEQRPATRPPHPLDVLALALHKELAPQGWEVWSFVDGIEVTCRCGQRVTITAGNSEDVRQLTLTPKPDRAGSVVLTDLNGLRSADHVSRTLGFLCSRHTAELPHASTAPQS